MDTSPIQSGSKCSSDFSIDRILNSDSGSSRSDRAQVPDWLCCTRYRPPRLQRAVNGAGGGCRGRRAGRHARVPFTAAQAAALEAAYARAPYLAPPALRALAAALQLRDDRIKIWFQNRRARERREKCGYIAPPLAVLLPPTTSVPLAFTPPHWHSDRTQEPNHYNKETENYLNNAVFERESNIICDDGDRPDIPVDIETIED